ncbi:hypothetical protein LTR85_004782 [Meristemomyces frigidus]|nr:hypothetical protein LTR85_004782 [Meristemomyces frigidus]
MASYPATPQTQTSHLRQSLKSHPAIAQQTRNLGAMQPADVQQPPLSTPASQESFVSVQSQGSSVAPPLQSSSSNLSQLTNYTDPTSPVSSAPKRGLEQAYTSAPANTRRLRTPENDLQNAQLNGEYAFASPMSVTSPVANAAKRTASGQVKNAPSLPSTPMAATLNGRRPRAESISSTGSRAGELAQTLKTRLGYAMAKVQNGWEHKSIAEVEQLAAHKMSPNRHGMSHVDYSQRPVSAGLSNGTARLSMYELQSQGALDGTTSPPSKRRSGTYTSFMTSPRQPGSGFGVAPNLQPPADIRPTTGQRQYYSAAPSSQNSNYSNYNTAMSPPRTPINGQSRRPPTLRTDTQTAEAERDALQALFQLGSPHASQVSRHTNASQASSTQASPLRTEYPTPRKVTFARSESGSSARASSVDGSLPDT